MSRLYYNHTCEFSIMLQLKRCINNYNIQLVVTMHVFYYIYKAIKP